MRQKKNIIAKKSISMYLPSHLTIKSMCIIILIYVCKSFRYEDLLKKMFIFKENQNSYKHLCIL